MDKGKSVTMFKVANMLRMFRIPTTLREVGMIIMVVDGNNDKNELYELIVTDINKRQMDINDFRLISGNTTVSGFENIGSWTPGTGNEYPSLTGLDNGIWSIEGLVTNGYLFTTGDLAGTTIYNGNGIVWNGVSWSVIADVDTASNGLWEEGDGVNAIKPISQNVQARGENAVAMGDTTIAGAITITTATWTGDFKNITIIDNTSILVNISDIPVGANRIRLYTYIKTNYILYELCDIASTVDNGDGTCTVTICNHTAHPLMAVMFGEYRVNSTKNDLATGTYTRAIGGASFTGGLGSIIKPVIASGHNAFNFSTSGIGTARTLDNDAAGNYSVILGGEDHSICSKSFYTVILGGMLTSITDSARAVILGGYNNVIASANNSVILGGSNQTLNEANTVMVPKLITSEPGEGIQLTSPDGSVKAKITIDNAGVLVVTTI